MEIVKLTASDLNALVDLARTTFVEAFAKDNSKENMEKYLATNLSSEQLSHELKNPESEFYFVKHANEYLGYLKVNYSGAQTELKESKGLEIERIYVLKKFYGDGVGQLLFSKATEIAKERGAEYIWLGVWEKNTRAIRFYEKNGFVVFGTHDFNLGNELQTDIMMKLAI